MTARPRPYRTAHGFAPLAVCLAVFLVQCGDGVIEPDPGDYPVIEGFRDTAWNVIDGAAMGTDLYVVGTNLSPDAVVLFGDRQARTDPGDSSDTRIRATVPAFDASQTVQVRVVVDGRESEPRPFRVLAPGNLPVGRWPAALVTADFDRNGFPDIATANPGSDSLSVLLGDGPRSYRPALELAVGSPPASLGLGDLDGDGVPDLVAAHAGGQASDPGWVSVFLGNGDGTFRKRAVDLPAGSQPGPLAVADLDRDGNPDLAVGNRGSDDVSVFLGRGDGTFDGPATYPTGATRPQSVAIRDLDGDGNPDLAVAHQGSPLVGDPAPGPWDPPAPDPVRVLWGRGDGSFEPARGLGQAGEGEHYPFVTAADLNGDPHPDLITVHSGGLGRTGVVSVFLGNGDRTFQDRRMLKAGIGCRMVAVGDLNADGTADLVAVNNDDSDIESFLGNGDGTFRAPERWRAGVEPSAAAIRDLDGNGTPDLAVALQGSDSVAVLWGNGDGTFQTAPSYPVPLFPFSVALEDFHGSGALDLAVASLGIGPDLPGGLSLLPGNGDGTFRERIALAEESGFRFVTAADLDGDHLPDLVAADAAADRVWVLLGREGGVFAPPARYAVGVDPVFVAVGDLDRDGIPDLAVANRGEFPDGPGSISVLLGGAGGAFRRVGSDIPAGHFPISVAIGRLNADEAPDLALVAAGPSEYAGTVTLFAGLGDGTFEEGIPIDAGLKPGAAALGDLNGDALDDLVVPRSVQDIHPEQRDHVRVYLSNGDGTFRTAGEFRTGYRPVSAIVEDLNRDGFTDLAVANFFGSSVSILLGRGDGTFEDSVSCGAGFNPVSVAAGDLNGTGFPDLAVANFGSGDVSVLLRD